MIENIYIYNLFMNFRKVLNMSMELMRLIFIHIQKE